jgi:hypothetical protein
MKRCLEPEWLDELPAGDPGAMGSRRDLRRLNLWMGNARAMERVLRSFPSAARPACLAELGAGDGDFLLQVARRLGSTWRGTQATLVDRQDLVTAETARGFSELSWNTKVSRSDVFDWCREAGPASRELILANLFLHHFSSEKLKELLRVIQQRSIFFVAIEPRRSLFSLAFSKLVRFIGCNAVTRHDAPASVRAGFFGRELSGLWPGNGEWITQERRVGPFSHIFVARKRTQPQTVQGP